MFSSLKINNILKINTAVRCYATKSTKRGTRQSFNGFNRNNKHYGQGKGKVLQAPRPDQSNKSSKHPSSSADEPYKFGSYSGLKLPDEGRRQQLENLIHKVTDFNQLRILPEVRDVLINEIKKSTVLRSQNNVITSKKIKTESELNGLIIRPTPIQTAAIKVLNTGSDAEKLQLTDDLLKVYTLAAETGSGKTWAYLAPMLHNLKMEQQQQQQTSEDLQAEAKPKAGIKSLIFVPTHELVDQVYATLENIQEPLNLRIHKWDTNSNFLDFMKDFRQSIDIMVTTPVLCCR
ncbi:unnamed protein product [Ambrosiozyma monospora]|uniref:ATP-dependent RNA helicase n=1 Tax=Ambrosiozyma monospora TaxID=43982 RepID=A0A9W6T3Y4_AMBMO|nr:unnamed protein product [Ambrosiozyma monospora]